MMYGPINLRTENETGWNCSRHGEIRKGKGNGGNLGKDWKEKKKINLKE